MFIGEASGEQQIIYELNQNQLSQILTIQSQTASNSEGVPLLVPLPSTAGSQGSHVTEELVQSFHGA
jgi:hypothetical protein